MLRSIT